MFTTAAQLLDLTDSETFHYLLHWCCSGFYSGRVSLPEHMKLGILGHRGLTISFTEKLLLVLRDGRKLIGVLRSWDQFGVCCSLLLQGSAPDHTK